MCMGRSDVVTVERLIPARPEAVFDLLVDPSRHPDFDGSGTVREVRSRKRRLALGDTFGMSMHLGLSYKTRNVVVELEENRRVAWQTLAPGRLARVITGRIWRYDLEPVEGGTLVRESWDISQEAAPTKPFVALMAGATRRNMERTLERVERILTDS